MRRLLPRGMPVVQTVLYAGNAADSDAELPGAPEPNGLSTNLPAFHSESPSYISLSVL